MQPIIKIENVYAGYGNEDVLQNASLTIFDHDFLGIIGPNGGGKTTLIKIILGLIKPKSGNIHFLHDGKEIRSLTMGYLPQYNDIDMKFPISVEEVILSGLSKQKPLFKPFTREQRKLVEETIHDMELEDIKKRPIGKLSGGQIQRVLLSRAIVAKPDVLILDEPNTYIDKKYQAQMYEMLSEINKRCAIILVSHDIGTILQNVKDVACVNKTLHYHPSTEVDEEDIEHVFGCPLEVLGHGDIRQRVLKTHRF